MNLSFAGCGFLGLYHVGVACAIKEYAPHLVLDKISGASAGSVAACALMCDVCLGEGTSAVLKIVAQARQRVLGPLHPSFNMLKILRDGMMACLPDNAHEICTGRLHISLTRFIDGRNVLVNHFDSKEELVQAIVCSSFIPFYCGTVPPSYKGVRYIDGGWSDNLPILDDQTITVSPFSGESDICPQDADSASYLSIHLTNTHIRFNSNNLYRFSVALFPPHPEVLSDLCRQGFQDALRFLMTRNLISCTRCISVRSSITLPEPPALGSGYSANQPDRNPASTGASSSVLPDLLESQVLAADAYAIDMENDVVIDGLDGGYAVDAAGYRDHHLHSDSVLPQDCEECRAVAEDAPIMGLPKVVLETLAYAKELDQTRLNQLFGSRPIRWLRYLTMPWVLPADFTIACCIKLLKWLPSIPSDSKWLAVKLSEVIQLMMREIDTHRHRYSARFSCQLAVTDLYGSNSPASGPAGQMLRSSAVPAAADASHTPPLAASSQRKVSAGFDVEQPADSAFREPGQDRDRSETQYTVAEMNIGFTMELPDDAGSVVDRLNTLVRRESTSSEPHSAAFVAAAEELERAGLYESRVRAMRSRHASGENGGSGSARSSLTTSLYPQSNSHCGSGDPTGDVSSLADSECREAAEGENGLEFSHTHDDVDAFESVLDYTRRQDALLTWYYLDENKKIRVTEIFGRRPSVLNRDGCAEAPSLADVSAAAAADIWSLGGRTSSNASLHRSGSTTSLGSLPAGYLGAAGAGGLGSSPAINQTGLPPIHINRASSLHYRDHPHRSGCGSGVVGSSANQHPSNGAKSAAAGGFGSGTIPGNDGALGVPHGRNEHTLSVGAYAPQKRFISPICVEVEEPPETKDACCSPMPPSMKACDGD